MEQNLNTTTTSGREKFPMQAIMLLATMVIGLVALALKFLGIV